MFRSIALTLLMIGTPVFALQPLSDSYLVSYGNPAAPTKITEFYSFNCPYCVALFQRDFRKLKSLYFDTQQIYFTFHPIPMDIVTIRAMHCLEQLNDREKQIFLEVILDVIDVDSPVVSTALMVRAMEVLKKPLPKLDNDKFLEATQAFKNAFMFIKQENHISAVPTVAINGTLFPNDLPDIDFFEKVIGLDKAVSE